jgi:DNA topoisomerase III
MKVILAEKPSVARDIAKVLNANKKGDGFFSGDKYIVTWTFGHLISLSLPDQYDETYKQWTVDTLPIIPKKFVKQVSPMASSKKQFNTIKKIFTSEKVSEVICATDAGREGELIFRYIYELSGSTKPIKRLWISSQTDKAIKEGFENLKEGKDYEPLHDSARSRAEADWLIGINATRLYTIKFSYGSGVMSVGRVQTPVLKMIIDRNNEVVNFKPEDYYEISSLIEHKNGNYKSKWFKEKTDRFSDLKQATDTIEDIKKHPEGTILKLTKKTKKENQPLLYDLTELQKDANKKFKFSADQTLKIAQNLYEKHKIITYPRTSSRYLSTDLKTKIKEPLNNLTQIPEYTNYAKNILSKEIKFTKRIVDDKKITDHHAIILTEKQPNLNNLNIEEVKLLDLIIKRFLCVFMDICQKDVTEIITQFGTHTFKSSGTIMKKAGWREIYLNDKKDTEETKDGDETLLPQVTENDPVKQQETNLEKKKTKAPSMHTEASILAAMETASRHVDDEDFKEAMKDCGLGTPATRAQILERLIQVKYIERIKNKLIPTDKGIKIISCIKDKELLSPVLTGEWEKKLNHMAQNKYSRDKYMQEITEFTKKIVDTLKDYGTKPLGTCPKCGKDILEKNKIYGCSNWKEGHCEFVIWKTIASKQISHEIVKELLTNKRTQPIEGFKSKKGNLFSTSLVFDEEFKIKFDFNTPKPPPVIQSG